MREFKDLKIAVAGTGDGDIIGTTKKNHVESGLIFGADEIRFSIDRVS